MKSPELNRLILSNGWKVLRQKGSHITYIKGDKCYTATFHGSKEVSRGLANKLIREMDLELKHKELK